LKRSPSASSRATGDLRWLREQLKECGGSEISVELAMGVIAKLLPEEAQGNLEAARQHARRWAH
jgi:hypothetical protein